MPGPLPERAVRPELPTSDVSPFKTAHLDETIDRSRLEQKTRRILAGLPEPYGLILLWRYWEKRSAREMADNTGKTEKAIERLLARARSQFKRRWMED